MMRKNKLSIRLTDNQMLVLNELKEKLHCGYSVMIRAMVLDFITRNEKTLEKIASGEQVINLDEIDDNNFDEDDE